MARASKKIQPLPRKSLLERGVLAYQDIQDQPKGKYFVIIDANPAQSLVFYADHLEVKDGVGRAWLDKDENEVEPITMFNSALPWYSVNTKYVHVVSTEQMVREQSANHKTMHELDKELRKTEECPEDQPAAEAVVPTATGQYL